MLRRKSFPKRKLMSFDADGMPPRADDVLLRQIHISAGMKFPIMSFIILSFSFSLLYLYD